MTSKYFYWLLITFSIPLGGSCVRWSERHAGRPEALAPILGARGLGPGGQPKTKPKEPVEDLWLDLAALTPAWPEARSELPRLIQAIIARGSWSDEHHATTVMEGVLRVRHRPEVIAQVRRFTAGLRARMTWPVEVHVAFVEVSTEAASRVLTSDRQGERRWDASAFRAAASRGEGRTLARAVLSSVNGQWVQSERVNNQLYLAGVSLAEGAITPQTVMLASGFTLQAAAWRWGEERAVVALSGLVTGDAVGAQTITQTVHRELPRRKKNEHQWEPHDVKLELPVRDLLEFQSQLTVRRDAWTVAAALPRDRKRICLALIRASWASPPPRPEPVDPLSGKGFVLEVIPVAMPTDVSPPQVATVDFDNRREISTNSASWFRARARLYLESQKKNTYNFQAEPGNMDLVLNPQSASSRKKSSLEYQSRGAESSPPGAMPETLERLRGEVIQAEWPEGSALEFSANTVFVVHRPEMVTKVRSLLEQTHTWRNQQVLVDLAFPVISTGAADSVTSGLLSANQVQTLRRGESLLPDAFLAGRGSSRTEIFVGEMHSVLSGAWPPDRSSPPIFVYWKGARAAIQPLLGAGNVQGLELSWRQHRLDRLAPLTVAAAQLQQPVDSLWNHQQTLQLPSGQSHLGGLTGEGGKLHALLSRLTLR